MKLLIARPSMFGPGAPVAGRPPRGTRRRPRRRAWVLLETVIATGVLIVGLAVIGAQVQGSDTAVRKMYLRVRAMMLAEMKLAELDMGLVELDSVDQIQEEEFGPRYPDFGWRLTTEETGVEEMYLLELEVLYDRRNIRSYDEYMEGDFDYDNAEAIHTVYALRTGPQPLNLGEGFGLDEEEVAELNERLVQLGIPGLDAEALDPTLLAKLDFEEFLEVLPLIAEALGFDLSDVLGSLPPGILDAMKDSELEGDEDESPGEGEE